MTIETGIKQNQNSKDPFIFEVVETEQIFGHERSKTQQDCVFCEMSFQPGRWICHGTNQKGSTIFACPDCVGSMAVTGRSYLLTD